jgi:hypothetical protein
MITTDSVFRDYTFCEKEMYAGLGSDTSTFEKFWDFEYDYYDTLTHASTLPERYVFNLRKGTVKYSIGSTRGKVKIAGFSYSGPEKYSDELSTEGSIYIYAKDEDGDNETYTLYFDSNTFTYSPASKLYEPFYQRKEYKVTKVTKK